MPLLQAPPSGITVRMYRHGFGDCFLLAADDAGATAYVLIDCGLFYNYRAVGGGPTQSELLRSVALDLEESTGGTIDTLVITHEHFDHLAGFRWSSPFEVLQRITFRKLWLAWTEDPDDPLATTLREEVGLELTRLRGLVGRLQVSDDAAVRGLLGFSENTAEALRNAVALVPQAAIEYLSPGALRRPFGASGPRFFVLGPPRSRPLLRTDFRSEEVYLHRAGAEAALYEALAAHADPTRADSASPFGRGHGLAEADARTHPFFARRYGFVPAADPDHDERELAWRRIDADWLELLEGLALQYDRFINNTSLVLAIELPNSRRVLLLPGDAQVGNWLSWAEPVGEDESGEPTGLTVDLDDGSGGTVTGRELVERTVFYKVGHHGSHNATLRAHGLERMRADELVAFLPTDESWAWVKQGENRGWTMPYLPLYRALLERTQGRTVQADCGLPDRKARIDDTLRPNGAVPYSEEEWQELEDRIAELQPGIDEMRGRMVEEDLYFQWTVEDT